MALSSSTLLLSLLPLLVSYGAANKTIDYILEDNKTRLWEDAHLVSHLCSSSPHACANFTLQLTTTVCWIYFKMDDGKEQKFVQISSTACKGETCHVEVNSGDALYHGTLDCKKLNHTTARCYCAIYKGVVVPI